MIDWMALINRLAAICRYAAVAWLAVWVSAGLAVASDETLPPTDGKTDMAAAAKLPADRARGITVTCFRWGPGEWDTPVMARTFADVQQLGANWISFHPYARIRDDGTVFYNADRYDPSVRQPLEDARRLGLHVMVKPHLAYWRSKFSWRGEITFEHEEDWQRFFNTYTDFIVYQAKLAEQGGADRFCIGLEYKKTIHREADWRRVIAAVREVYSGPITYAANWDEYEQVAFWDAVDEIGVQFYFPLAEHDAPSEADLHRGFDRVLNSLEAFSKKHGKPILLTELGYPSHATAAKTPWQDNRRSPHSEGGHELKLRCMRLAIERSERSPFISGVFLWKWFPTDRDVHRPFSLQYPQMRSLLAEMWKQPGDDEG